jgi:hypothetical protein
VAALSHFAGRLADRAAGVCAAADSSANRVQQFRAIADDHGDDYANRRTLCRGQGSHLRLRNSGLDHFDGNHLETGLRHWQQLRERHDRADSGLESTGILDRASVFTGSWCRGIISDACWRCALRYKLGGGYGQYLDYLRAILTVNQCA